MHWIVSSNDSGVKLLKYISQHLGSKYSLKFLKRAIEHNCCQINDKTERFASTLLGAGDQVVLNLENIPIPSVQREEKERVLFEDSHLLVYDKPSGVNCDAQGILKFLQKRNPSIQLIHRLDRDTTGVILLAKNPQTFGKMVEQFKQHQVQKRYFAFVDGLVAKTEGTINNHLGKLKDFAGQSLWGSVNFGGLAAITEWKCIKKGAAATLLECTPKTGRTHQLRVHLSEMGHPILGDFQYGKKFRCAYRPARMLLHSQEISFYHPITGEHFQITAPIPEDFKSAQEQIFG